MTDPDHQLRRLQQFWNQYAMPPKSLPSCLVCGKLPAEWPPAIQHLRLPSIIVCTPCVEGARAVQRQGTGLPDNDGVQRND